MDTRICIYIYVCVYMYACVCICLATVIFYVFSGCKCLTQKKNSLIVANKLFQ